MDVAGRAWLGLALVGGDPLVCMARFTGKVVERYPIAISKLNCRYARVSMVIRDLTEALVG